MAGCAGFKVSRFQSFKVKSKGRARAGQLPHPSQKMARIGHPNVVEVSRFQSFKVKSKGRNKGENKVNYPTLTAKSCG